jgi:hypothetical protein
VNYLCTHDREADRGEAIHSQVTQVGSMDVQIGLFMVADQIEERVLALIIMSY